MSSSHFRFEPDRSPDVMLAVEAWRDAGGIQRPELVERLVEFKHNKVYDRAGIFRLPGAGLQGASVVAKRGPARTMAVEAFVFNEVLPALSLTAPVYYGYVEKDALGWLFIEEVIGEPFSYRSRVHQELAVRWLSRLHSGTSQMRLANRLPAEGPEQYVKSMESARQSLVDSLDALTTAAHRTAAALLEALERIARVWGETCQRCARMPHCLVHADFVNKNVMIVPRGDRHELIALDWGIAGWGVAAPDLEYLTPSDYFALVKPVWTELRLEDIAYLKAVGVVMRHLGLVAVSASFLPIEPTWAIERLADSAALLIEASVELQRL